MTYATVYARQGCPDCERAKELLADRNIPFEVKLEHTFEHVPTVFIDGTLIGGVKEVSLELRGH